MAYLQSRSGIARSGVTSSGWVPIVLSFSLDGTSRLDNTLVREFQAETGVNMVSRATFTLYGVEPTVNQDVEILISTPDDILFGGTIVEVLVELSPGGIVLYHCTAAGYEWLVNSLTPVTKRYDSIAVNTIVRDLVANYAPAGFSVGYVPANFGTLSIEFAGARLYDALQQIASAMPNAFVSVSPTKVVSLCQAIPDSGWTLGNTSDAAQLQYRQDFSQVRTRTIVEGVPVKTTAAAGVGATTLTVDECGPFVWHAPTAPMTVYYQVRVGHDYYTLTNVLAQSGSSGPGWLTLATGLLQDVAVDEAAYPSARVVDTTAETAYGRAYGSNVVSVTSSSMDFLRDYAFADVQQFKGTLGDLDFVTRDRRLLSGSAVFATVTTPITIAGTFYIKRITATATPSVNNNVVFRQVKGSAFSRTLMDLLRALPG